MTELQTALQSQAIQKVFQQFSDTVTAAIGEAMQQITQPWPDSVREWPQAGDVVWMLDTALRPSEVAWEDISWKHQALAAGNVFRTKADCDRAGTAIRWMLTGYKPVPGQLYVVPVHPSVFSYRWEKVRRGTGSMKTISDAVIALGWAQPDTLEGRERAAQISREIWPGGVQS